MHLLRFVGYFDGKIIEIIGLEAPGNYSASIWSNKFSNLLLDKAKPNIFMISDFLRLLDPAA